MKSTLKNILRTALAVAFVFVIGEGMMWGNSYYHARMTVKSTGTGTVYVGDSSGTTIQESSNNQNEDQNYPFTLNATPGSGWHFVSWSALPTGKGTIVTPPDNTASATVTVKTASENAYDEKQGGGIGNDTHYYYIYEATATFEENYYVKVNTSVNSSDYGEAYVALGSPSSFSGTATSADNTGTDGKPTTSDKETFSIKADPEDNYHFVSWSAEPADGVNIVNPSNSETIIDVTGKANRQGKNYPAEYVVTATFEINVYSASLTVNCSGTGTAKAEKTHLSTSEKAGGDVTFNISAEEGENYHFVRWEKSGDVGTFGDINLPSTTFKVPASTAHGEIVEYTVTAVFEKDQYYAKLNTGVSQAKEGTEAGSAQVKTGDGESDWADSHTKSADSPNTPVEFEVKATPKVGYQFIGWAKDETSTTDLPAGNTYSVNSSNVQGGTNEETIYAVFDKGKYKVHFLPNEKSGRPVTDQDSMPDVEFTSGVDETLPKNQFVCHVIVTYDAQGGTSDKLSEEKDRFSRWKEWVGVEDKNTYTDGGVINRMEVHNNTVNLQATWKDTVGFYLPNATREHHGQPQTFLGWFDSAEGGNLIGGAGTKVTIGENEKTLYAHWGVCDIKITTVSSSYTTGDNVVFAVDRIDDMGGEKYHSRISVPIGGSKILKDVPMGTYKIVAEDKWSWNYTSSEVDSKEVSSGLTEFSFTVNSKSSPKKHDETSKTKGYDTTN